MDGLKLWQLHPEAARAAEVFLRRPGVRAVHLADVPHLAGDNPPYPGPFCRLILIAGTPLLTSYALRRARPPLVADAPVSAKRLEKPREAVLSLLGLDDESFGELIMELDGNPQVWLDNEIDVVMLPEAWYNLAELLWPANQASVRMDELIVPFPEDPWYDAQRYYQVYNPNTRVFARP